MHQLTRIPTPGTALNAFPDALETTEAAAPPERLPWGSAALVLAGLCLVLWGGVIAAVAALL